jgi:hypothetical protein
VRTTATQATDGWSLASVVRTLSPDLERVFAEHETFARDAAELRARIVELEASLVSREAGWRAEHARSRPTSRASTTAAQIHARTPSAAVGSSSCSPPASVVSASRWRRSPRRANADREETLQLARDMVQSAEDARFAVVEELESLRAALAAEQARLVEVQQERVRVSQGAAERDAELAHARQMIEQLEASRASGAAELARTRTALVRVEGEVLATQHEYQLAQVQIERLCSAQDDMVEDRAQFVAKLHDAKEREARLRLRIAGLEQRILDLRVDPKAVDPTSSTTAEPATPTAEPSDDSTSRMATELSRAEERSRALERELATAKASASAATARISDLQAQARTAELARAAAAFEAQTLRTRLETVEQEPVEAASLAWSAPAEEVIEEVAADEVAADEVAAHEVAAAAEPMETIAPGQAIEPASDAANDDGMELVADDDPVLVATSMLDAAPEPSEPSHEDLIDEAPADYALAGEAPSNDAPSDDEPAHRGAGRRRAGGDRRRPVRRSGDDRVRAPRARARAVAERAIHEWAAPKTEPTLAILDASIAWRTKSGAANVVQPDDDACERVRALGPDVCIVNLAATDALAAATALRAGGLTVPLWGCAIAATGERAWPLGRFDVVTRPIDPESAGRQLAALASPGANVIMAGCESATQIPLRQSLSQAGLSVRTAWDRKQAVDLADTRATRDRHRRSRVGGGGRLRADRRLDRPRRAAAHRHRARLGGAESGLRVRRRTARERPRYRRARRGDRARDRVRPRR